MRKEIIKKSWQVEVQVAEEWIKYGGDYFYDNKDSGIGAVRYLRAKFPNRKYRLCEVEILTVEKKSVIE